MTRCPSGRGRHVGRVHLLEGVDQPFACALNALNDVEEHARADAREQDDDVELASDEIVDELDGFGV